MKKIYNTPLISTILPIYNAVDVIEQAVASVSDQSLWELEIILIDDCSTDNTVQIIENMYRQDDRIILLKNQTNQGVAETRNRGIANARGKYIAFLDADDIWYPEKLQVQLECLESTGADLCYSSYRYVNQDGSFTGTEYIVPSEINYQGLLRENVIGCSTVVVRAKALKTLSFSKEYAHEDYALWLEMLKAGKKAVGLPQILVDYREGGRSANKLQAARNRWIVYRKSQKLSLLKSLYYFINYAFRAVRKFS